VGVAEDVDAVDQVVGDQFEAFAAVPGGDVGDAEVARDGQCIGVLAA
jgi:hypothetical protein